MTGVRCTTGSTGSPRMAAAATTASIAREVDRPALGRLRRAPVERRRARPPRPRTRIRSNSEPNGLPGSVSGPSACTPSQPRGTLRADAGAATSNAAQTPRERRCAASPAQARDHVAGHAQPQGQDAREVQQHRCASAGSASDSRWKASASIRTTCTSVTASSVAERGLPSKNASSPDDRRRVDRLERRLLARDPHGQRAVDQQVQRAVDLAGLHEREPGARPRAPRRRRRSSPSPPRSRRAGRGARPSPRGPPR